MQVTITCANEILGIEFVIVIIFQNNIKIFSNYGNGVSDISVFESVAKNYIELQKDDTSSKYTKKTANSVNYLKSLNL